MITADQIQERITSRFAVIPFSIRIKHKPPQTPEQSFFWDIKLRFNKSKHKLKPEVRNALRHLVYGMFTEDEGVMVD